MYLLIGNYYIKYKNKHKTYRFFEHNFENNIELAFGHSRSAFHFYA